MDRYKVVVLLLICPLTLFAQLSAGPDDTINPGVPVTLTATYGLIGTGIGTTDDGVEGPFPIGFTFMFFGKKDSLFWVGANGWMAFSPNDKSKGIRQVHPIPNRGDNYSPVDCIFGPFCDFDPSYGGSTYIFYETIGQAPNRSLIVMWCDCPMYNCLDSTGTFQVILNEGSNTIESQIMKKSFCDWLGNKALIGVQNTTGYLGFAAPGYNYTSWTTRKMAWRFTPVSPDSFQVAPAGYNLRPITPGDKLIYRWFQSGTEISESQSVVVTPNETTTYIAYAKVCAGDEFYDTVTVHVLPRIPDAFTPNGDGLNDKFRIIGLPPENITRYNLQIFDRWGQLVFETNDILNSWDGSYKGHDCPADVYTWVMYYETTKKTKISNKGQVTIIR